MDFHGDHTCTCTAHSGATKAHDWMVSVLGPLFRTAGHTVRTQHGVTASAGQRRGDVEIRKYLRDQVVPTRLCILLRSARSIAIGNNTLTIREPEHAPRSHALALGPSTPGATNVSLKHSSSWVRRCRSSATSVALNASPACPIPRSARPGLIISWG